MRNIGNLGTAALMAAVLSIFVSAGAEAQQVRTFVSGHGTDTGICGVTTPCRHFSYAITQTGLGGEIVVQDSAGYGTLTINQAISITSPPGVEAAITVPSGDGITIAAGVSDTIDLTGITLTAGSGANGITFTSGGRLNIKNCVARGFTNAGLNLVPGTSSNFNVSDTIVSNNFGNGILVQPTGAATTTNALFERVQVLGNTLNGLYVNGGVGTGTLQITATNSDASDNGVGLKVQSVAGQVATLTVVNSTAVSNALGIVSTGTNATMFVAGSTVSGNGTGFFIGSPAVMKSFGNNNIVDTSNTGSLQGVGQQ